MTRASSLDPREPLVHRLPVEALGAYSGSYLRGMGGLLHLLHQRFGFLRASPGARSQVDDRLCAGYRYDVHRSLTRRHGVLTTTRTLPVASA